MKYNKNAKTFLFLLLFTTIRREKNIEKTFLSAAAQKMWNTAGSGSTLPQYLPNPKSKFPVKFPYSIFVLLSSDKKAFIKGF